jgi:hypothetical protein
MKSRANREKGQAIVLIALAFVALIAFTALAIDGGMVYSDRRHAQNAVDTGSLAGGGEAALYLENQFVYYGDFSCTPENNSNPSFVARGLAENAAELFMVSNGYSADIPPRTECQDSDSNYFQEKYIDVITEIITDTQTSLIHFVYDGPVRNRVTATTRIKPRIPTAFGHAVVALNDEDDCSNMSKEGVVFSGNGTTLIDGGGVWSNGCLKSTSSSCNVDVTNGNIAYGGDDFGDMCGGNMDPGPTFQDEQMPENSLKVETPDCSKAGAITVDSISKNTDLNSHGAKLICVTDVNNAVKVTNGYLYGNNITIYLVNGGDISISGGDIDLSAPGADPDPSPGITGVLFYVNPVRDSTITLNGNNESKYLGMIFAPRADVTINGTSGTNPTFNTQIIGWNVEVSGNATLDINFDKTWTHNEPTALDLQE